MPMALCTTHTHLLDPLVAFVKAPNHSARAPATAATIAAVPSADVVQPVATARVATPADVPSAATPGHTRVLTLDDL